MKKTAALLMTLLIALSLAACGGGKRDDASLTPTEPPTVSPTAIPTVSPSAVPSAVPTEEVPSETPAVSVPKHEYSYDEETHTLEDEFIRVTLPDNYSFSGDMTEEMQSVYPYDLYISFFTDEPDEDFASNIIYFLYSAGGSQPDYTALTREAMLSMMEATYDALDAAIEDFEFRTSTVNGCPCMECDFSVELMGINCRQTLWSITRDGTCIVLTYSYTDGDASVCRDSIDSIIVK